MNIRRASAIARKEFRHVWKDRRSLAMAIALPITLLVLFGFALTLDVDRVPIVVWDQSETPQSRELISRFAGSRYFSVTTGLENYETIERSIDARDAMAAMIIPPDFAEKITTGKSAGVQLILDGSDSNTALIALGYAQSTTQDYSQEVLLDVLRRSGGQSQRAPLDIRPRVWFNEDLESRNYIIPGLIAVIMSMVAALLTSLTVAREWERGTMEQLISTPVKPSELILGKLAPYFVIGMLDMTIVVGMGVFLFKTPFRGSPFLLVATSCLFLIAALSQGMFISVSARSQMMAAQIALLTTFLPAFLLSGFAFAIENMPYVLQYVTYVISARYFVTILKGLYMKGVGVETLWPEIIPLLIFCAVMLGGSIKKFRKLL
jgi:ABC-2 type transport system permease protein